MEQRFYRDRLGAFGVEALVPNEAERTDVHRIIYEELCRGVVKPASKGRYREIVARAARESGVARL